MLFCFVVSVLPSVVVVVVAWLCLLLLLPSFLFVSFSATHFIILPVGFGLSSVLFHHELVLKTNQSLLQRSHQQ